MKFLKLPKDSRARSLVYMGIAIVVIIGIFFYLRSGSLPNENRSSVAQIPQDIQNIPGGKVSPEYYRTLVRANELNAQNAEMSGQSSMATLVNTSEFNGGATCTQACCACEHVTVDPLIKKLMDEGKLSPEDANELLNLAKKNVSVDQYADELDKLVKSGRLTPEQARDLLAQYKKQHTDQLAQSSAAVMDNLIKSGRLPVDVANELLNLQKAGIPVDDYAAELQRLVKEGKISPETAAALLDQYKSQREQQAAEQAKAGLEAMVKSGAMSQETADALAGLQSRHVPVSDYAAYLNRLVKEGKLSPEAAKQLLAQYAASRGESVDDVKALSQKANQAIDALVAGGQLSQKDADVLKQLQSDNVPVSDYEAELKRLVSSGALSPEAAAQLLANYKALHAATGADALSKKAMDKAKEQLQSLAAQGLISMDVVTELLRLMAENVPVSEYAAYLAKLVKEGKLTPEQAKTLLMAYEKAHDAGTKPGSVSALKQQLSAELAALVAQGLISLDVAEYLWRLQQQGVSVAQYAEALQALVKEGKLSPAIANRLLAEYRRLHGAIQAASIDHLVDTGLPTAFPAGTLPSAASDMSALPPSNGSFDSLQRRMEAASNLQAQTQQDNQVQAMQLAIAQQKREQHQQRITQLSTDMKTQAGNIVKTFDVADQVTQVSTPVPPGSAEGSAGLMPGKDGASGSSGSVVIKAGDVQYAVLDTAVDSDYPQSPIMATIVQGPFTGAKLLGTLITGAGVNADRVILNFTQMSMPNWPASGSIQAYAIDPNTANSAMATSVNDHYLMRYGALFASSFLQGYSQSLTQAGTTVISTDGSIQTTKPVLSPKERMWVAIGQVGTNAGQAAQDTFNMPPTIKVKSGVGLGILFMQDVTPPTS